MSDPNNNAESSNNGIDTSEEMLSKRRNKEVFGDCALIEIIHLHDCLRGALKALEQDVQALARELGSAAAVSSSSSSSSNNHGEVVADLERRVAGRFKVIWSVFKSHSHAEDEFIWPALQTKTQGRILGATAAAAAADHHSNSNSPKYNPAAADSRIEQEEYEEDHADEERMFSQMDLQLTQLREVLLLTQQQPPPQEQEGTGSNTNKSKRSHEMAQALSKMTRQLSQHLMAHLEKEETQCMPLVVKHLSKQEIHELVGQIMGQRSSDTISEIMTMAVQNLDEADREEMVKYMKQSMAGTFFDRWLTMSGWNGTIEKKQQQQQLADIPEDERKRAAIPQDGEIDVDGRKKVRVQQQEQQQHLDEQAHDVISQITEASAGAPPGITTTSQAELEKLIRAIATNPSLTPAQKNTTIQGLRDSVWKSNQREKERNTVPPTVVNVAVPPPAFGAPASSNNNVAGASVNTAGPAPSVSSRTRRVTPPSMYFKKNAEGKIEVVWNSGPVPSSLTVPAAPANDNQSLPLFSAAELAPTYHDGAAGAVLGCPHYARACKLRHPVSGRLYTCRLCCEQQREMPMKDQDEPLDRYSVTEVMCMRCNALQPAEDRCINSDCESRGKPFAKYFCRICHLYDDGSRPIFHCPYCNLCRLGLGLGVDFRHCMRCNACVSLSDDDHHCIPQKLQGSCPICHEDLFQSTEPLRGLKCGHVMHLSCFTEYRRGHSYTCPLCMRSMEDMDDYFALLDTAIRMQPMPLAYLNTMSNIYCQDCCETGRTPYHFVGQKCPHCGSYNTREMGRVHNSPRSSPTAAAPAAAAESTTTTTTT